MYTSRPAARTVEAVRLRNANAPFSYSRVGATRDGQPDDWFSESRGTAVGSGLSDYQAAVGAMRSWQMFALSWVCIHDATAPIREGEVVAFTSRQLGLWSIHTCRIVYTVDEVEDSLRRFGFAYGTLQDHAVAGEERFTVTWDAKTDAVRYEITKFSLPQYALLRVAGPLTRSIQARFTTDSFAAMHAAVNA